MAMMLENTVTKSDIYRALLSVQFYFSQCSEYPLIN